MWDRAQWPGHRAQLDCFWREAAELTASVLCLDAGVSSQCFKVKGPRKATLEVNPMQADRVIGRYAIGGAVAATFYLEPAATLDLDLRDASGCVRRIAADLRIPQIAWRQDY